MRRNKAFTLIEVMIALMILSLTLLSLSTGQAVALNSTRKMRLVTMATIVAKNMMSEIELMSDVKGFNYVKDLGEKTEGNVEGDDYKGWKWKREVKEVNLPISTIMNMFMEKEKESAEEAGQSQQADSGMEAQIMSVISTNIEKIMHDALREITITVSWPVKGGKEFSEIKLVYYVVDFEVVQNFVPVM